MRAKYVYTMITEIINSFFELICKIGQAKTVCVPWVPFSDNTELLPLPNFYLKVPTVY